MVESNQPLPPLRSTAVSRHIPYLLALGILLRLFRYWANFPLWGDECLLADNFLWRDYAGLAQPLNNGQVAPLGYLWGERLAVTLWGFHEWSLRLQGLLFGILALLLFARVAVRSLDEWGANCAIGIFAISYFGIRYSAETKPYADDLFCAVALLACVVEWNVTRNARWLWGIACLAPVALFFSFPAIFVAGGISLGIFPALCRRSADVTKRSWQEVAAYVTFNLAIAATFFVQQRLILESQYQASSDYMISYWKTGFPPGPQEPLKLLYWIWDAGTSALFAVPFGGENSGSIASTILFVIGLTVLIRQGRNLLPCVTAGILLLAFVAAALKRYPISDHPRLLQYFAPVVALGVGEGVAAISSFVQSRIKPRFITSPRFWGWGTMIVVAGIMLGRDVYRPYQVRRDQILRELTTQIWKPRPDETVICLSTNLPTGIYEEPYRAVYNSYRALNLSDADFRQAYKNVSELPSERLTCIAFHYGKTPRNEAAWQAWMTEMQQRFKLVSTNTEQVTFQADPIKGPDTYEIFEFVPRD